MKTVLIGLDGATWNVLDSLIEDGYIPNLKFLIKKGSSCILKSTIPPVTGCCWLSLSTSLNPGKTGVIDFLKMDKELNLRPVSSSDFEGRAFWDLLSNAGNRCVVLDYPMLFPAYQINGAIISTWSGELTTFPKQIKKDIRRLIRDYDIFVGYHDEKYNDIDLFLHDLNKALERKIKVTKYLLNHLDWDIFVNIISFTDWIQHRMWHYIDESHPWYDKEESQSVIHKFGDFWKKIDDLIGEMIPRTDYLFIVSDHGMGPQYGRFNIAKWLELEGYLKRKHSFKRILKPIISSVQKTWLTRILPEKLKEKGRHISSVLSDIDLKKSGVYLIGHSIPFGCIYINPKTQTPSEMNNKIKEKEILKNELITSLTKINDITDDIEVTLFDKNKIYSGNKLELLPDIIFTLNDWRCVIIKNFQDSVYTNNPYSNRHTGSHRMEGIFLAYGPEIKNGICIKPAKIYDVAPTLLHMFDVPIPREMDGKVIRQIFEEKSELAERPITRANERERIKERIRRLKE